MIRIFIENKELDVLQDFSHQITYSIDDIANLDTKTTAFSKTIVLPGTANNNKLLGNIFEFSNSNFTIDGNPNVGYNFNASKSAKVYVESNGLQIMKGVLRLLEIVIDGNNIEYEVGLFGELGGFVSAMGTKRLQDLDFSIYNHVYNKDWWEQSWQQGKNWHLTNTDLHINYFQVFNKIFFGLVENDIITITNSTNGNNGTYIVDHIVNTSGYVRVYVKSNWPNPGYDDFDIQFSRNITSGFYYPLIDYGKVSGNKHDYYYTALRPALFVRDYLTKIIASSGYTFESEFIDTDFFRRLVIPNNDKDFIRRSTDTYLDLIKVGNTTYTFTSQLATGQNIIFQNNTLNDFTYASGVYTYTNGNTRSINITGKIYYNGTAMHENIFFIVKKSNTNIYGETLTNTTSSFEFSFNTDISYYETLTFKLICGGVNAGASVMQILSNSTIVTKSNPAGAITLGYGDNVIMNDILPSNIFQKDFFISILKMFNLMVVEDKFTSKHLKIIPYTLFYDLDNASYLDWTSKVDRSEPIRIKPMSEVNSRYYELKYKGDSDYYNDKYKKRFNQGYGDVKFDNNLEFVKDTQTSEVIFGATPLVGYQDEDKVVPTIFKWDGTYDNAGDQQNEDNVSSVLRIMQIKNVTGVTSWNVNTTGSTLASYTTYPYAGHFDDPDAPNSDINFGALNELYFALASGALGNNLFNAFYSPYLAEITDKDSRLVTCKMKFTETDIFNLNFSKFIWIDQVLYRLNKIYDYTPNELCKVDLLRVIYTTYDDIGFQEVPASVQIGTQRWTSENLKQTSFLNGDVIALATNSTQWNNYVANNIPCYAFRNYNINNINDGLLYNVYALRDERGLGYYGWRIPEFNDLSILQSFVTDAYPSEKAWTLKSTTSWFYANGTDRYGFNAKGFGYIYNGTYSSNTSNTYFALSNDGFVENFIHFAIDKETFSGSWNGNEDLPLTVGYYVRLIKI
jgi:uncharacterized protein (TIGR02145 family)